MKILLINTTDNSGGAAIAATRLRNALQNMGEKARMLVARKRGDDMGTFDISHPLNYKWQFMRERLGILLHERGSRLHLWDIDPATCGVDITKMSLFKEADVIHLHWVNQGFLSLKILEKILNSGKPIVWTMHDSWPFTGLCHSPIECRGYEQQCGNCPILASRGDNDWSRRLWLRKQQLWGNGRGKSKLAFVACSQWLAESARRSSLLSGHTVIDIPNPIDNRLFAPRDKGEARRSLGLPEEMRLILFSAFNVNAPIKGLHFLREACNYMVGEDSSLRERFGIICAGKEAETLTADASNPWPVEVFPMGYVTDPKRMATIYNAADVFCIPSLQENLPNTIAEAKTSGVSVVGFRVGGIPQMIDHMNDGYLAEPEDAADLAKGLHWALWEADSRALAELNRTNAVAQYSETRVAERYLKLYASLKNEE
ncbi:MAG: glycosyltransferase family 4 protein [Bacteroidaceae bacterium]|nr:glycosyltransferase family 4 protein [Bacteroidaceae bacterium]